MATLTDLETLGYTVGRAFGNVYRVKGFGVSTMVADDDADALASLADPAAHTERKFQHEFPEESAARFAIEAKGYDVVRPDPVKDVFDVKNDALVVAKGKKPADLPPLADELPPLA